MVTIPNTWILFFMKKIFIQLCQQLHNLVKKAKKILEVTLLEEKKGLSIPHNDKHYLSYVAKQKIYFILTKMT
jgi:hypothetical protein